MKYKLIWRANPQDRTKKKLYAIPVNEGTIAKSDLTKDIVSISSLSNGIVSNVIEDMTEIFPKYLLKGKSISLGNIGAFRISFGSEGVDDKADFNAGMIDSVKVIFTPSIELKKQLRDIHFEPVEDN